MELRLGIDIGGTGIKGAPVDVDTGELREDRYRLETPKGAHPDAVAEVVQKVAEHFELDPKSPVGITFPGVVLHGVVQTAANVAKEWIGYDADTMFSDRLARPVSMMNDADAAGVAEMRFGAGAGHQGVVVMITLGTGIGSAVFIDGTLVPNTELGHIEIDGKDAETQASGSARDREELSHKAYAKRLNRYLKHLDSLLWPDLMILGGGVSKQGEKYLPHLDVRCQVKLAELRNNAGIVGAAINAG
jgi:polyphosphate glucokinase